MIYQKVFYLSQIQHSIIYNTKNYLVSLSPSDIEPVLESSDDGSLSCIPNSGFRPKRTLSTLLTSRLEAWETLTVLQRYINILEQCKKIPQYLKLKLF